MLGYKHTKQAIEKMKSRFVNKINHPMFGKTHDKITLSLISKPGKLNPMFVKTHISEWLYKKFNVKKKSLRPLGLYDENYNLIEKFSSGVQ